MGTASTALLEVPPAGGRTWNRRKTMNHEYFIDRLYSVLVTGDRREARRVVQEMDEAGVAAEDRAHEIFWPLVENVGRLYRADQLSTLAQHYAVRLLRTVIDAAQASFLQRPSRGRSVLLFCGNSETDELAGQLVADLTEADGYEVLFGGGGVAVDEVLEEVGAKRPDVLLMFSSAPGDAPNIRQIIDTIRGVNACPELQIVVGGGVFNRAEGLAEEIGADLWARTPRELLDRLGTSPELRARTGQRTVGRTRRAIATPAGSRAATAAA